MAEARGFRNSSSCWVVNKLKAIKLTERKIEKERVTLVDFGMNERRWWDEMSDVEREVEGRKNEIELSVIGIEMMFYSWIRYKWAKWSGEENVSK